MKSFMPSSRERRVSSDRERAASFVGEVFADQDLHSKRLESLANGVAGTMRTARVSIHAIGQAYAEVADIRAKHGVKQIDRYLSNPAFDVWRLLQSWAAFVVGGRPEVVIALDWTDFEDDDHTTLAGYVVTQHGRATPLAWRTVRKSELKGRRVGIERAFLDDLAAALPCGLRVTLLADRGFADHTLYAKLEALGWRYAVRFRRDVLLEHEGKMQHTSAWLPAHGRATMIKNPRITAEKIAIAAVVVARSKKMKEDWCLATNVVDASPSSVVKLYGKRFTIEETFRDQKDMRFGLGLRAAHIRDATRRDRLLLLVAMAHALLTLLGAAAEAVGLDRALKVNTSAKRTHSLFRQGTYWYAAIPHMREEWLVPLINAFDRLLAEQPVFAETFGAI
jgi:hypothetical protein